MFADKWKTNNEQDEQDEQNKKERGKKVQGDPPRNQQGLWCVC
jgi:hypothetical protein